MGLQALGSRSHSLLLGQKRKIFCVAASDDYWLWINVGHFCAIPQSLAWGSSCLFISFTLIMCAFSFLCSPLLILLRHDKVFFYTLKCLGEEAEKEVRYTRKEGYSYLCTLLIFKIQLGTWRKGQTTDNAGLVISPYSVILGIKFEYRSCQ